MPSGAKSGSGEVAGFSSADCGTPLACSQSSAKKPCSCVSWTRPIVPTPGAVAPPGMSAPTVPPDCVPAVRLSPTPTMRTAACAVVPGLALNGVVKGWLPPPPPEQAARPSVAASAAAVPTRAITAAAPWASRGRTGFGPWWP